MEYKECKSHNTHKVYNKCNKSDFSLIKCCSPCFLKSISSIITGPIFLPVTITSILPSPTTVGSTVTITGTGFVPGETTVTIGGVSATITSITDTTITVTVPAVPPGTQPVVVTTPGGSATGSIIITGFAPCVLGEAANFAILAATAITNTGPTVVTGASVSPPNGNVGLSPGTLTSITGFPPGIVVNGTIQAANAVTAQAQADLVTAASALASVPCTSIPSNLGGQTLTPGTYCVGSSANITGTLTLNGTGNPNGTFTFLIPSTLTTAAGAPGLPASIISLINTSPCNVFFVVGSSATLGTYSVFQGSILAHDSITATTGASIVGRLLANTGAVTLDSNPITNPNCGCT